MDYQERDVILAERWHHKHDEDVSMKIEDLTHLVCNGFQRCEYHCTSRERCGEDACACVRTVFPTPNAYLLYQQLRDLYQKMNISARIIASTHGETDGERKQMQENNKKG